MAEQDSNIVVGRRYQELNGLRAVAATMVIWLHAAELASTASTPNTLTQIYTDIAWIGSSGVTLFFVISGFLITGILIDTKDEPSGLKKFYIRRALRILPLYYFGLVAIFLLLVMFGQIKGEYNLLQVFVYHILYVSNWVVFFDIHNFVSAHSNLTWFTHLWSLAVEQQFYIVWPALFLFLYKRISYRVFVTLLISLAAFSAGLRIYMTYEWHWVPAYTSTPTRMDALFMGAVLAVMKKNTPEKLVKINNFGPFSILVLSILTLAYLLATAATENFFEGLSAVIVPLTMLISFFLTAALIVPANEGKIHTFLKHSIVQRAGDISYGLYIYSHLVQIALRNLLAARGVANFWLLHFILLFLGIALAFIIAGLSYDYIEKPISNLKKTWAPYKNRKRA
ncbi:MAG: acyltransferase [Alphaproteobacteria bacterium]|nr:acyltransferase [Alphaproteobacteria bacterium]